MNLVCILGTALGLVVVFGGAALLMLRSSLSIERGVCGTLRQMWEEEKGNAIKQRDRAIAAERRLRQLKEDIRLDLEDPAEDDE